MTGHEDTRLEDTHGRGTTSVPMAPGALPVPGHTVSLMRGRAAWLSACRRTAPV